MFSFWSKATLWNICNHKPAAALCWKCVIANFLSNGWSKIPWTIPLTILLGWLLLGPSEEHVLIKICGFLWTIRLWFRSHCLGKLRKSWSQNISFFLILWWPLHYATGIFWPRIHISGKFLRNEMNGPLLWRLTRNSIHNFRKIIDAPSRADLLILPSLIILN